MKNKTKMKTRKRERGYIYLENVKSQLILKILEMLESLDPQTSEHHTILALLSFLL